MAMSPPSSASAVNLASSASCSLGALLGLGPVRGNEMLDMLDWLLGRQGWVEKSLARRHLEGATLLLYDVSSSYLEGRCSPLAAFGHNRDGKQGKQQIVFDLLCAADGCSVAVDVFAGNTADPSTVGVLRPCELEADGIAEIRSPDFPGERLLVCLNRRVGRDVSRKKVDKHFAIEVTDDEIRWSRKQDKINAEAQLDGIYVIRTSLQSSALGAPEAVEAYKSLAHVERAFRSLKTAQLAVRPIFVYSEDHVRGHILLCMLAYDVEWHLRRLPPPAAREERFPDPVWVPALRHLSNIKGGGPGGSAGATAVAGGESAGLGEHQGQGRQQADARGAARALLPDAAGGSGHAHAERGDAAGRPAAPVSDGRQADAAAGQGIRLARGRSGQICCQ